MDVATIINTQEDLFPRSEIEQMSEPTNKSVFEALADPRWDFRTVQGIANETGLSEDTVRIILDSHPNLVRQSSVPDRYGRPLFTLRGRPINRQERIALLRMLVTKSIS